MKGGKDGKMISLTLVLGVLISISTLLLVRKYSRFGMPILAIVLCGGFVGFAAALTGFIAFPRQPVIAGSLSSFLAALLVIEIYWNS